MNDQHANPYVIPLSIVISGVLVAGAILYAGDSSFSFRAANVGDAVLPEEKADVLTSEDIRPVGVDEHILGNPSAPVKIIEYSDLECPFCAQFHPTLQQVMEEYGKDGRVAWVYRHFPLESIHPTARSAALGSECAAELGGQKAFWDFIDGVFARQQSGLNEQMLSTVAVDIGLDSGAFTSCLRSGRYTAAVDEDMKDALAAGAQGTPYSVIISQDGTVYPVNGAQSFTQIKNTIEQAL